MRQSHQDEQYTRHDGGYCQSGQTVLLDNAVDDDNECPRGTSYLHFAAAEDGYQQSGYDSRHKTLCRSHARGYTEGDSQGDGYNAHDDTRQGILSELTPAVVAQRMQQFRRKNLF